MTADHPGQRITIHEGNIGSAGDCRRVLAEVIDPRSLDIVVNNAGITVDRTAIKMPMRIGRRSRGEPVGRVLLAQAALQHMSGGHRRIVNMSLAGESGNIGQTNYAASKSGMFGLTKTMAREAVPAETGRAPGGATASG